MICRSVQLTKEEEILQDQMVRPPPVDVFSLNYILLGLSGIWPPEGLPRAATYVYMFLSVVAHTLFFTSSFSYTLGMVLTSGSIDAAIGASSDVLVIYLTNYKIFVLLKNKRLLRGLVDTLKYELDVLHPPLRAECRRHDEEMNRFARKVAAVAVLVFIRMQSF